MTDKTEAQPEALRLAEFYSMFNDGMSTAAASELRRLHAEIQQLKAELSARQAAPDGWRIALERIADPRNKHFAGDAQIVALDALSAAPPPPEREPLTPDSSDVVTDEEMQSAFAGTNFGTKAYRHLLHQALLKKACEYHCGHTITQIMKELGLISVTGRPLRKGIKMLRIAYREQMMEGP